MGNMKKLRKCFPRQLSALIEWQFYDEDFVFKSLKFLRLVVCAAYFQRMNNIF